jgi:glyceraldehyde-3-phosphate dehydrogenase (NADP+)
MSLVTTTPVRTQGFYLQGKWTEEGTPVEIRAPYDGAPLATVFQGNAEHAERAIQSAVRAFGSTRRLPAFERQRVLRSIAQYINSHKDEFARTMAQEAGKPLKAARTEVERAVFTFTIAAEETTRIPGEYLSLDWQQFTSGRWGIVRRFPLGPIAGITPFNFPLNLVAHKLAPALACGAPVVLKPAPQAPLSALNLARIINDAGAVPGSLNVLLCHVETAQAMVGDDRLKVLSFTGSAAAGWALKSRAGKKRVLLELGGNAGVAVHSDSDLDHAAARCVYGGFAYAGQVCIAVQRIYVHRPVFDSFLEKMLEGVSRLRLGDPLEEATDVGPLISRQAAERTEAWVREAVHGGAKILAGGQRDGSFFEPTVLTNTKAEMKVCREEVFGPVVTVEPYDRMEQALAAINDSPYGLQAGLFTHDSRAIAQAFETLEVGGLLVNEVPTWRADPMPYGGAKDSGLGREGVRYAIEELTERRALVMNSTAL